jgi:hypothetical protein
MRLNPRRPGRALAFVGLLLAWACDAPPEFQPETLLRDSLGLTTRDRVHTIDLSLVDGGDRASPLEVRIRPGERVAFRSGDGFFHRVRFPLDSLTEEARAWVLRVGLADGPPLLGRGAVWVVPFERPPPGRFPFLIEGNGREGGGVVIVEAEG